MLVRFLTSVAGLNFDHGPGDVVDVDETWGQQMVASGTAERLDTAAATARKATAPPPVRPSPADLADHAVLTPPEQATSRRRNRASSPG